MSVGNGFGEQFDSVLAIVKLATVDCMGKHSQRI
jgi:hypothetical protein